MANVADEGKINRLAEEIGSLSDYERLLLYERLHTGTVEIHDWLGEDRTKPRAVIHRPDGTLQTIHIVESVEENAVSIGHPAILLAIRRWERVVRFHQSRSRRNHDQSKSQARRRPDRIKSPIGQEQIERYDVARGHLERIGAALFNGAKKHKVGAEKVLQMYIHSALPNYRTLDKAYSLITQLKCRREELMPNLRRALTDWFFQGFMGEIDTGQRYSVEWAVLEPIFDFLQNDLKMGSPLTNRLLNHRLTRNEFRDEFDAWRFNIDRDTIKTYRRKAQQKGAIENLAFLLPEYTNAFALFALGDPIFFPTEPSREDR